MQKEENEKPLFICFPPLDYPSTHQSSFLAKVWEKTQQHLPSRIFAEISLDHTLGMGGTTNQIIQDILHFLTITQGGLILTLALFVAQKGWISWYITTLGNCLVVGDLQQPITPFLSAVCAFNIFQLVLLQLHLLLWGCASLKQFRGKVVPLRFSCW